jgi:hypothetical protein
VGSSPTRPTAFRTSAAVCSDAAGCACSSDIFRFLPSGAGGSFVSVPLESGTLSPWTGLAVLAISATIELAVPSQDGRLRTPGDSKAAASAAPFDVLGVIVPGQRGRCRGVVFTGSCPEHMTLMGPA